MDKKKVCNRFFCLLFLRGKRAEAVKINKAGKKEQEILDIELEMGYTEHVTIRGISIVEICYI